MPDLLALIVALPQTPAVPHGIGREWLPIASVLVPFLLLVIIIYAGRHRV